MIKGNFIIAIVFILICLSQTVYSQMNDQHPELQVDANCPDIKFAEVEHFTRRKISTQELLGRWAILDFWNEYCPSCVASFPATNNIQHRFRDSLQIILVGYTGSQYGVFHKPSYEGIRRLYERCVAVERLDLPIAYDSSVFTRFNIHACPFVILIDPRGKIRYIGTSIDSSKLHNMIFGVRDGVDASFQHGPKFPFDPGRPFLTGGNGGLDTEFQYRALISNWTQRTPIVISDKLTVRGGKFEVLGARLEDLYKLAYWGIRAWNYGDSVYKLLSPKLSLLINDRSKFVADYESGKNVFCYSIVLPDTVATRRNIMKLMQRELEVYFRYQAHVERKLTQCWKLVLTRSIDRKIRTSGGKSQLDFLDGQSRGVSAKNCSIDDLLSFIYHYFQFREPPFINGTNIHFNIDIQLDCLLTNLNDVQRSLSQFGFRLIKVDIPMDVLIIQDLPKNIENE